jgi:hypothetical protein
MKILITKILMVFLISIPLHSQSTKIPNWLVQEWEHLTYDTGIWITDNAAYQNENEPYDAYGLEWEWGLGKNSIKGKLFGIKDGENVGTFWEFRTFWHSGKEKAFTEQFGGDGTYGVGEISLRENDIPRMLQTFYSPDGSSYKVGHESVTTATEHKTTSYFVDGDDNWIKNRNYIWKPQQPDFNKFSWLLGNWQQSNTPKNKLVLEQWVKAPGILKGTGFTIINQDTTVNEHLQIIKKEEGYFYVADVPSNQAPVFFKITSIGENTFTAINPEHDFPQKITYTLRDGILYALISGATKKFELKFKPI